MFYDLFLNPGQSCDLEYIASDVSYRFKKIGTEARLDKLGVEQMLEKPFKVLDLVQIVNIWLA